MNFVLKRCEDFYTPFGVYQKTFVIMIKVAENKQIDFFPFYGIIMENLFYIKTFKGGAKFEAYSLC